MIPYDMTTAEGILQSFMAAVKNPMVANGEAAVTHAYLAEAYFAKKGAPQDAVQKPSADAKVSVDGIAGKDVTGDVPGVGASDKPQGTARTRGALHNGRGV